MERLQRDRKQKLMKSPEVIYINYVVTSTERHSKQIPTLGSLFSWQIRLSCRLFRFFVPNNMINCLRIGKVKNGKLNRNISNDKRQTRGNFRKERSKFVLVCAFLK